MATTISLTALTLAPSICEGRLTLETGVPVSTTDQLAKSSIYWTPYHGNRVALYDGTSWKVHAIASDLTLALGTKTAALPYDVFMYDNAGDATLEDLAWTNTTTRATALTLQDGVLVKSGAVTRRYVGTYFTASTTTTADSGGLAGTTNVGATRYLWNYYHRVRRPMRVIDTTATWGYTTNTWRQARATAGNKVEYVTGAADLFVDCQVIANIHCTVASAHSARVAVGIDSTTTPSGLIAGSFQNAASAAIQVPAIGTYRGYPGLGYHALNWLECGADGASSLFLGSDDSRQSGMTGVIDG